MSIKKSELKNWDKAERDYPENAELYYKKINQFREACGMPMVCTSFYRSKNDQIWIYAQKGITDIKKIPMGSAHLTAQAADFADKDGKLYKWAEANQTFCGNVGLWFEHRQDTPAWIHIQIVPPKSGRMFFRA